MGHALARYGGFGERGFRVALLFDSDPTKIGQKVSSFVIEDAAQLVERVRGCKIKLAMMAVPAAVAARCGRQAGASRCASHPELRAHRIERAGQRARSEHRSVNALAANDLLPGVVRLHGYCGQIKSVRETSRTLLICCRRC